MENLSHWYTQHRWLALTSVLVGLVIYGLLTEGVPRSRALYGLFQEMQTQRERIASVDTWQAEKLQIQQRRTFLEKRFADLYVNLPKSDQMSIILQVLHQSAQEAGITLQHVRPAERIAYASYDELPFEVDCEGSFHGIGLFANTIEQSRYLMKVHRLRLTRDLEEVDLLEGSLTLSVIILKEQTGAS